MINYWFEVDGDREGRIYGNTHTDTPMSIYGTSIPTHIQVGA